MSEINLDELSAKQLEGLKDRIDNAIENRRNAEMLTVRHKIDALVAASPFSLKEILEALPAKRPVVPKYRHPDDAGLAWTGRGRKPLWVMKLLESGQSLESLAIAIE